MESECISINFGLGANGKYLCELSSSDHELHPQDLKHRSGFIYGPTQLCRQRRISKLQMTPSRKDVPSFLTTSY